MSRIKEEILSIASDLREGNMNTSEALIHLSAIINDAEYYDIDEFVAFLSDKYSIEIHDYILQQFKKYG